MNDQKADITMRHHRHHRQHSHRMRHHGHPARGLASLLTVAASISLAASWASGPLVASASPARLAAVSASPTHAAGASDVRVASVSPAHPAAASTARVISLNESGDLHLTSKNGFTLNEQGSASGTVRGTIYVHLSIVSSSRVTAELNIYPHGGSLTAHGSASYHKQSTLARFSGTMSIERGTGSYAHAQGSGLSFSGTIQRSNDAVTVHVAGRAVD
jgi:hypothetical protein